jgi:SAM-dependent methyltransferase
MTDIAEHQRQIEENLRHWQAKPVLRDVYRDFHRLIAKHLSAVDGDTVEIGSGIGNIQEVIPHCVRTDLFPNPWIDRQENVYRLSMTDGSAANIILFDVFHHLEYPLDAMEECGRVLRSRGRLLVFDHAMSAAGLFFSKFLHHERAGFFKDYALRSPAEIDPTSAGYYADHANAHRILVRRFKELLGADWKRIGVQRLPALKWLCSGGYRGPSLVTVRTKPLIEGLDRLAALVPSLTALRLLVVLERR